MLWLSLVLYHILKIVSFSVDRKLLTCILFLPLAETISSIANQNGISVLATLISNEDNQVKRQASTTFAKALKSERNQALAKESGVINTLASQISSNDASVASSAAIAITALSKNGTAFAILYL